jgi:Protein of unknown function (DUF4058)
METPFPGMDPYLEHPALWPSVHVRLVVALADQLGPRIRPRYVASVEDRVFIESADPDRIRGVWVQETGQVSRAPAVHSKTLIATPLVVEVQQLEVREHYIAILDRYLDLGVVTVIELVSPTNKAAGIGRDSYMAKQREIRGSECHLVEIDLLRRGSHVMSVPEAYLKRAKPFDYLVCVNRWPARNRFELYRCNLRDPLPTIGIPLADPDPDVPLALQSAIEHVCRPAAMNSACATTSHATRASHPRTRIGPPRSGPPTAGPIPNCSRTRTAAEARPRPEKAPKPSAYLE